MKKYLRVVAMLLVWNLALLAQTPEEGGATKSHLSSISFSGGGVVPTGGRYDAANVTRDILRSGPAIGASVSYALTPLLSLRGSYDFWYNNFADRYKPTGQAPAFVAPTFGADLILNFGSLIDQGSIVNPYCFSGPGISFWKFTQDGTCGKGKGIAAISPTGSEWKDCSVDLHTGLGVEVYLVRSISLFAEAQYRFLLSANKNSFGGDFGNLSFFKTSGGVTYYFCLGSDGL